MSSSHLVFEPWAMGTLCVKILLWNGRTCSMSSWTSGLWIELRTPAMSTTAHLQRKAFNINFKEEHSSNWTSGESPHEHSPAGKAALERKCCPSNWELESLCLLLVQWLRATWSPVLQSSWGQEGRGGRWGEQAHPGQGLARFLRRILCYCHTSTQ